MKCVHCGGNSVKRGFRFTKRKKKQLFLCTKCGKKFTPDWPRMRFSRNTVMHAVELYKKGSSLSKVQGELKSDGVKVSRWTILKWYRKYG